MPPKKKCVLSTTIRWSSFEVGLFRYLTTITHRSMAGDLRAAIRLYARQLPQFSEEGFAAFMKSDTINKMPKGPERDQVALETEAFAALVAQTRKEVFDASASRQGDGTIASSAADFEFN